MTMAARPGYAPAARSAGKTEPFDSAEEAWFWTMAALVARRDGARIVSGAGLVQRPCEPDDVVRCLDRLYRQRRIDLQHARILRIWGERGCAPDPRAPREGGDFAAVAGSDGAAGLAVARQGHRRRRRCRRRSRRGTSSPSRAARSVTGGRRAPARRAREAAQRAFIVFGGGADQPWLRLLRRGFRHCFAALEDAAGWTVLDPLSGRLVVARLDLPARLRPAGVLPPRRPRRARPVRCRAGRAGVCCRRFAPFSCVSLCRAVLGAGAPFAVTPFGLFRALARESAILGK